MSLRSRLGGWVRAWLDGATPPDPRKMTGADIASCYRLLLDRTPDAEGLRTYEPMIGSVDVADLVTFFIASPEFKRGRHYRTIVDQQDAGRPIRVELGTHVIHVLEHDPTIGGVIRASRTYEPHVTRQLSRAFRAGATFVDVGASVGFFTLLAAASVGPTGHVYAFEPSPVNCKLLTMSLVANRMQNVTLFPAAVSDVEEPLLYDAIGSNGFVSRLAPDTDVGGILLRTVVGSVILDRVLADGVRVDVLKIDVEGAEHRALTGAARVLREHRPLVVSEFGPAGLRQVSGVEPDVYLSLFTDAGYELAILRTDGAVERHGRDRAAVVAAHEDAHVDHIDIVAFDPSRHRDLVS